MIAGIGMHLLDPTGSMFVGFGVVFTFIAFEYHGAIAGGSTIGGEGHATTAVAVHAATPHTGRDAFTRAGIGA